MVKNRDRVTVVLKVRVRFGVMVKNRERVRVVFKVRVRFGFMSCLKIGLGIELYSRSGSGLGSGLKIGIWLGLELCSRSGLGLGSGLKIGLGLELYLRSVMFGVMVKDSDRVRVVFKVRVRFGVMVKDRDRVRIRLVFRDIVRFPLSIQRISLHISTIKRCYDPPATVTCTVHFSVLGLGLCLGEVPAIITHINYQMLLSPT